MIHNRDTLGKISSLSAQVGCFGLFGVFSAKAGGLLVGWKE